MEVLQDIVGYNNRKIYHDDKYFSFGLDSLSLAYFTKIYPKDKKIIDLGSGNGIIPLILSLFTDTVIDAVEIQEELCNLFKKSIDYNKINNIKVYNVDMKKFVNSNNRCCYDIVTCNPPYFENTSRVSINNYKAIARSEVCITLEEIIFISNQLLKDKGRLYIVYRVDRFDELVFFLLKYKYGIKKVRYIYNKVDESSKLVLVEAIKNRKCDFFVDKPLIILDNNGEKTEEYKNILGGNYYE